MYNAFVCNYMKQFCSKALKILALLCRFYESIYLYEAALFKSTFGISFSKLELPTFYGCVDIVYSTNEKNQDRTHVNQFACPAVY